MVHTQHYRLSVKLMSRRESDTKIDKESGGSVMLRYTRFAIFSDIQTKDGILECSKAHQAFLAKYLKNQMAQVYRELIDHRP